MLRTREFYSIHYFAKATVTAIATSIGTHTNVIKSLSKTDHRSRSIYYISATVLSHIREDDFHYVEVTRNKLH
jgi:hypothetical protein